MRINLFLMFLTFFYGFLILSADVRALANPAGVYCSKLGYDYKINKSADGGTYGVCVFPDGNECEEWNFYAGKCAQKYSYCAKNGYDMKTKNDGMNPFSPEYSVCVINGKETSITNLVDLVVGEEIIEEKTTVEAAVVVNEDMPLPSSFFWSNKDGKDFLTPAKDQGLCGSCWAFAAVGALEAKTKIENYNKYPDMVDNDGDVSTFYSPSCPSGYHPISCVSESANEENEGNYGEDDIITIKTDGSRCKVTADDTVNGWEQKRKVGVVCSNQNPTIVWDSDWQIINQDVATFYSPYCPSGYYPIACLSESANKENKGKYGEDNILTIKIEGSRCKVTADDTTTDFEQKRKVGVVCSNQNPTIVWDSDWQIINNDVATFYSPSCPSGYPISCISESANEGQYGDDDILTIKIEGSRCKVTADDTVTYYEQKRKVGVVCSNQNPEIKWSGWEMGDFDLSEQAGMSCQPYGDCRGGISNNVFEYAYEKGIPDERCNTYGDGWRTPEFFCWGPVHTCKNDCANCSDSESRLTKLYQPSKYIRSSATDEDVKRLLITHGPIVVNIIADQITNYFDGNGVWVCPIDNLGSWHSVVLTGYSDLKNVWILKNSWGNIWGSNGYFQIYYGDCFFTPEYYLEGYVQPSGYPILCNSGDARCIGKEDNGCCAGCESPSYHYPDITDDGEIDIMDIVQVASSFGSITADLNNDGVVDHGDWQIIINTINEYEYNQRTIWYHFNADKPNCQQWKEFHYMGDLNNDGYVDMDDISVWYDWKDYVVSNPVVEYSPCGDINKNGWIDIFDIVSIASIFGTTCE